MTQTNTIDRSTLATHPTIVALLISAARPATADEIWQRIGLSGSPASELLPGAAAWGGYPGGLTVIKGDPLFPRRK